MITKLFKTKGNDSKLNKSVFIFEGLPWSFVVACFAVKNLLVSFHFFLLKLLQLFNIYNEKIWFKSNNLCYFFY
jgi:hypothetical protein